MTSVSQTNYSILQDNQSTHWNEYYSQYTNLDLFLGLARTLLSNVIKIDPCCSNLMFIGPQDCQIAVTRDRLVLVLHTAQAS